MESNNNNNNNDLNNQYSSKLADSTWVPPSNNTPYDTNTSTPLDNEPLQNTNTANVVVTNSIGNNISPYNNNNATPNSLNDNNNLSMISKKSYKERYADVKQLFNSPSRATANNVTSTATAISNNQQYNISCRHEDTKEVVQDNTPLQRWERRKERKLMERGGGGVAVDNNKTNTRGRSRTREYDAPASSRVVINDDGYEERMRDGYYQEYDDLGKRSRTSGRHSSQEYDSEVERGRRSRTRSPSNVERLHRSRSRTGRSTSRGGGRPDPLDYEEEEEESLRMNDCESSPLYHHHHEDAGGDINDNHHYSPSSIDDIHFDNRRGRSRSPVSSRGRRSKSIPTRRDSNNEGRERKYKNNSNSTYADDLKSFTESVIASPTPATNHHQRQSVVRTHNDRQYKPYHDDVDDSMMMEQGTTPTSSQGYHYHPDMAVPVTTTGGGVSISSSNYHSDQSQYSSSDIYQGEQQQQQQRRVRHKASDICRKFTTQRYRSNRDDNDYLHSSTIIVKSNNRKRYLWIALTLCSVCIVAAALSVYFLGKKHNDDTVDTIDVLAMKDTIEPSISTQPSNLPTLQPINDDIPTNKPTNHPLSIRDTLIIDYLSSLTKGSSNVINTPQYMARMWILYDDPLRLHLPYANYGSTSSSSSSSNSRAGNDGGTEEEDYVADWESNVAYRIKQRYALATLYYALHIEESNMIDHGWLGSVADECEFVEGKNGQQRQAWEGVGCDDEGNVRVLMLDGGNLQGEIPSEISLLNSIENLIIKNNPGLVGKIPYSLGQMRELRQLGLYSNGLSSTIPKNIFQLEELVYVNLSDNNFVGTIPWNEVSLHLKKMERFVLHNNYLEGDVEFHELAKIPSISLLSLSNNLFDGNIETVGLISSLEYLYLDGNKLVGSIPGGISDMDQLKALNLDENALYGTLPHTIGNLTSLEYLSAKGNTISGGLPAGMKKLHSLSTLNLASNAMSGNLQHLKHIRNLKNVHLYQNEFTGNIIGEIFTALNKLEVLFLSSNSLTGSIPLDVVGAQKTLKGLFLSDNKLEGTIPREVCGLYKIEDLFFDENNLNGALPSCLGNLSALRQFYAFKNNFSGNVPRGLLSLPYLDNLGIEQNDIMGGLDEQTCSVVQDKSLSIWADCSELNDGCECCERCCTDQYSDC